jgi:hypothetical protein
VPIKSETFSKDDLVLDNSLYVGEVVCAMCEHRFRIGKPIGNVTLGEEHHRCAKCGDCRLIRVGPNEMPTA